MPGYGVNVGATPLVDALPVTLDASGKPVDASGSRGDATSTRANYFTLPVAGSSYAIPINPVKTYRFGAVSSAYHYALSDVAGSPRDGLQAKSGRYKIDPVPTALTPGNIYIAAFSFTGTDAATGACGMLSLRDAAAAEIVYLSLLLVDGDGLTPGSPGLRIVLRATGVAEETVSVLLSAFTPGTFPDTVWASDTIYHVLFWQSGADYELRVLIEGSATVYSASGTFSTYAGEQFSNAAVPLWVGGINTAITKVNLLEAAWGVSKSIGGGGEIEDLASGDLDNIVTAAPSSITSFCGTKVPDNLAVWSLINEGKDLFGANDLTADADGPVIGGMVNASGGTPVSTPGPGVNHSGYRKATDPPMILLPSGKHFLNVRTVAGGDYFLEEIGG